MNLPTGTITLLFTDIEGSTKLWEQGPDQMKVALACHDALLREAIESNHGVVFKTMGDAFCSAFATAPDALPNNLPRQLTSFIGRDEEMAELKRLLGLTCLLTVVGSGGCGKTRLAVQVGADLLPDYVDGVWLIELAPFSDPSHVPQAVASALHVREEAGRSLVQTLTDCLKSRHLLLLVDNAEHVLDACAQLADTLLRRCPHLKMLVTSREALGIDRAAAVVPTFAVTHQNASAVAQVCFRLDGIPLAIELAAARVRSLSVEEVNARLEDRFRLLTGGSRTAIPRQQTLRSLIDWSYNLLNE